MVQSLTSLLLENILQEIISPIIGMFSQSKNILYNHELCFIFSPLFVGIADIYTIVYCVNESNKNNILVYIFI